mgnify:CR=1 FL=1
MISKYTQAKAKFEEKQAKANAKLTDKKKAQIDILLEQGISMRKYVRSSSVSITARGEPFFFNSSS